MHEGRLSLRAPLHPLAIAAATCALALAGMPATSAAPAVAASEVIPFPGYTLHDESQHGRFRVLRWTSADVPDISPAGTCDCIIEVYVGKRLVLKLGTPGDVEAITVGDGTGSDLDGDGREDLVISMWSGGAHCCYSVRAYSVGRKAKALLSLDTGDCGAGEFSDLDHDGTSEFLTCDESWKDRYCGFALTPFPTVVYAYDAVHRRYHIATPRYARYLDAHHAADIEDAERAIQAAPAPDSGEAKCAALHPALDLVYGGNVEEGLALIRRLYKGGDLEAFLGDTEAAVRASTRWVPK